MTGLRIQYEMVKAMAFTESLMFTAGQIFGSGDKGKAPSSEGGIKTADEAMAFARSLAALG